MQSGGSFIIESNNRDGIKMTGQQVSVHAGGLIEADRVHIKANTISVAQAGVITANAKVSIVYVAVVTVDSGSLQ